MAVNRLWMKINPPLLLIRVVDYKFILKIKVTYSVHLLETDRNTGHENWTQIYSLFKQEIQINCEVSGIEMAKKYWDYAAREHNVVF